MVRIIWQDIALEQLKKHLEYSATEFGIKTMNKFIKEVEYFEERLKMMPESYTLFGRILRSVGFAIRPQ